jgi:hypothetical protein
MVSALETRISYNAFNVCFIFQLGLLHTGGSEPGAGVHTVLGGFSQGRVVQVDSIKTRAESAYAFSA